MHIQIINFNLKDMTRAEYNALCTQLGPTWAAIPGLVSKVWLANPKTNTYGGVYTWRDRAAMEAFLAGELFAGLASNPNFVNATISDFEIDEAPTRVTRGAAAAAV